MMSSAKTVAEYLAGLPPDRRAALTKLRDTINARLPPGYEESMGYGMAGWYVPLSRFPVTYNGQPLALAGLASQKKYMALYLMTVYMDRTIERWFRAAFKAAGKKLDMGKSCVRFKSIDDLPLDVIGDLIARVSVDEYCKRVEAVHGSARKTRNQKPAAKKPATKKPAAKKPARPARRRPG